MAIQSAWVLGAGRVIAIDRLPERLRMAETYGKAETINFECEGVYDRLMDKIKGPSMGSALRERFVDDIFCWTHQRQQRTVSLDP